MENNTTTTTTGVYSPSPLAVFAGNVISVSIATLIFSATCYAVAGCIVGARDLIRGPQRNDPSHKKTETAPKSA